MDTWTRTRSGVAATAVMTAPMLARWALQRDRPPPPRVVTETLERKVGVDPDALPRALREAAWALAHLAFGGLLALPRTPRRPVAHGALIWLVNYGLALPLVGLYPRPGKDDRRRALETFFSHLVYAAALRRLSPSRPGE